MSEPSCETSQKNPSKVLKNKPAPRMSQLARWRRAKERERQIVVLTESSLRSRWDIIISILRLVVEKRRKKKPDFVFSSDLLREHRPGNVYNVIDLLNKRTVTSPPDQRHPHNVFQLKIPSGLLILSNEVAIWDQISEVRRLTELQAHALKVIRQLLQEIEALTEGSSSIKLDTKNSRFQTA